MRKIILILTFILTTLLCFGQKEHLEPAKDINQYEGLSREYRQKMYPLLYSGFTQNPYARYTSEPSFSSEYAFSVEKNDEKFFIITNILSENYWDAGYSNKRDSVKVNATVTEINSELYQKIGELFVLLVEQIKEKERIFEVGADGEVYEKIFIGVDGTNYSFATTDKSGEIRAGTTRSPNLNDNPMFTRLVRICDDLCSFDYEKDVSQSKILEEINNLINDLK